MPAKVTLLRIIGKVLVSVMLLDRLIVVLDSGVASLLIEKKASRSWDSVLTAIGV